MNSKTQVAVVGYGVIGKRVADAVGAQPHMALPGVAEIPTDRRVLAVAARQIPLYWAARSASEAMRAAGLHTAGPLDDLLRISLVLVHCTPKRVGARDADLYCAIGLPFVLHGGEKHEVTGHSFVAESNNASAVGRQAARVVSCNTTSTGAHARSPAAPTRHPIATRDRSVGESPGWPCDTVLPKPSIPSHQGPELRSFDPDLDIVTMATTVPTTAMAPLGHGRAEIVCRRSN